MSDIHWGWFQFTVLPIMPYLVHPPIQALIRAIPVVEHSVEVDADFWRPICAEAGQLAVQDSIFAGRSAVRISRQWLRTTPPPALSSEVRTAAALLWGYPRGARGDRHRGWFQKLPEIATAASRPGLDWPEYYAGLNAIHGLGISTISKLAYFFGHAFAGEPALILDQRILRVMASGRWAELAGLQSMTYLRAPAEYRLYLTTMADVARAGGFSPDQLEFFLFALGDAF